MNTDYNKNRTKVFTFRISEDFLNLLRNLAEQNKRSIAKQIEFMLERQLENQNFNIDFWTLTTE